MPIPGTKTGSIRLKTLLPSLPPPFVHPRSQVLTVSGLGLSYAQLKRAPAIITLSLDTALTGSFKDACPRWLGFGVSKGNSLFYLFLRKTQLPSSPLTCLNSLPICPPPQPAAVHSFPSLLNHTADPPDSPFAVALVSSDGRCCAHGPPSALQSSYIYEVSSKVHATEQALQEGVGFNADGTPVGDTAGCQGGVPGWMGVCDRAGIVLQEGIGFNTDGTPVGGCDC